MKKSRRIFIIITLISGVILLACNNPAPKQDKDPLTEEDLKEQSDNFDKSMNNVNDAMDLAKVLNEKIQIVEAQFEQGLITREKADELINDLNARYTKTMGASDESVAEIFPAWLLDLKITEPKGLSFNAADSYQTSESDIQDGYNSVLFIYNGSYQQAMAEAKRIAEAANIPLSESYQKAKDLADKLGEKIKGVDGIAYLNYKFGESEFQGQYKISLSVDNTGKMTIHVVDEKMKNARKEVSGLPKL